MKWRNVSDNGAYACIGPGGGIEFILKMDERMVWQATVTVDGDRVGTSVSGFDTVDDAKDWAYMYGRMLITKMIKELEAK